MKDRARNFKRGVKPALPLPQFLVFTKLAIEY